ncbi:hypothetical protein BDM02DRAFT_419105 [Thelephora ganbajun]|uniref:Uncharacterized protein n=1 Tax=Thelephora ganbajun TaxID=370292 RepID=A0ACB6YW83_THEGA|nr:hypothetical protein BDM02DRAFT_419105 [Thelephora ganbajun]
MTNSWNARRKFPYPKSSETLSILRPAKGILRCISSGKSDGATGSSQSGKGGFFVEPTISTNVSPSTKITQDEIFGPVAVVIKFKAGKGIRR